MRKLILITCLISLAHFANAKEIRSIYSEKITNNQCLTVTEIDDFVLISPKSNFHKTETVILAAPFGASVKIDATTLKNIQARFRDVGVFRYSRLIAVDLTPLGKLVEQELTENACIKIGFNAGTVEKNVLPSVSEDRLTTLVPGIVLNPGQAKRWMQFKSKATEIDDSWYDRSLTWYKLSSDADGVVSITEEIDFSGEIPGNIMVYANGSAIPVYIVGEEDGQWDSGDKLMFRCHRFLNDDGTENKYTDENVYWIATGTEPGVRMSTRSGDTPGGTPVTSFSSVMRYDDPSVTAFGEYFTGSIRAGETKNYAFQLPNLASQGGCHITAQFLGMTSIVAADPDHHMIVSLNGTQIDDAWWDSITEYIIDIPLNRLLLNSGTNTLSIHMPGDTEAGELDGVYLDWFSIEFPQELSAISDELTFSMIQPAPTGLMEFTIDNFTSPDIQVWRLDDDSRVTDLSVFPNASTYSVRFTDYPAPASQYIAFSASREPVSFTVTQDKVSNLLDPNQQADILFITHPLFEASIEPLIQHRQADGYTVRKVNIQDIYDEFNQGVFSPEAIRAFIQHVWNNWTRPAPVSVLLIGDACWDYKNHLVETIFTNYIPTYGKDWGGNAASSPYDRGPTDTNDLLYGEPMVDEQMVCVSGDDNIPDLMIGRLAVTTTGELQEMIARTIAYETNDPGGDWWKRCYFINGGFNDIEQATFNSQSESLIENFISGSGASWIPLRTYKSTSGHEHGFYTDEILAIINRGVGVVNYFGHAGTWSWEAMLSFDDISNLENGGRTPFISSMTCNTSRFANPTIQCFGEKLLTTGSVDTGAVAVWGGCNFGGFWSDYYLAYFFYKALLLEQAETYGSAILQSKIENLVRYPSYAIITEPYVLLGDPLLKTQRSFRPQVNLAGYLDTQLSVTDGGEMTLVAYVTDANGLDDIASVELLWAGEPTGLELLDDGNNGDFGVGDGIFGLTFSIPPSSVGTLTMNLGVRAVDSTGNTSGVRNGVVSW